MIVAIMSLCNLYVIKLLLFLPFFFFKQNTAYEMRISDWSSDVCSSDLKLIVMSGASIKFTPATSARPHSRLRSDCTARCVATSDDEQAVSIAMHGPWTPKLSESRPEATLAAFQPTA